MRYDVPRSTERPDIVRRFRSRPCGSRVLKEHSIFGLREWFWGNRPGHKARPSDQRRGNTGGRANVRDYSRPFAAVRHSWLDDNAARLHLAPVIPKPRTFVRHALRFSISRRPIGWRVTHIS